MLEEKYVDLNV